MLALMAAAAVGALLALSPRRRRGLWLGALTVMLFALPRAGMVIKQVNLPLPIAHVLAGLVIVEWFVLRRTRMVERSRVGFFVLLYGSMAALGLVIGLATGGDRVQACLELCFYVFSLGLYFYASETFCNQSYFKRFAVMLLALSVAVSLYGIAQRYMGQGILIDNVTYTSAGETARGYLEANEGAGRRVLSSYGDPNVLSTQLIFFVAIGLALAVGRGVERRVRWLSLVVVAVNAVCIVYTGSRAGILCLAVVAAGIVAWRRLSIRQAVVAAIGLVLLALLMVATFGMGTGESPAADDSRWQYPHIVWQLWQAVPLGCGFGNTVRLAETATSWSFEVTQAGVVWAGFNSFWLNLLSRLGLPGVLSLILLIVALVRYIVRQLPLIGEGWVRAFVVGGLIGFGCQWMVGLVNNTYMLPGGGLNYWFLMGMLVAGCRAFALRPYPIVYPLPDGWEVRELSERLRTGKDHHRGKEAVRESCILLDDRSYFALSGLQFRAHHYAQGVALG